METVRDSQSTENGMRRQHRSEDPARARRGISGTTP